jgi:hypothetical protein
MRLYKIRPILAALLSQHRAIFPNNSLIALSGLIGLALVLAACQFSGIGAPGAAYETASARTSHIEAQATRMAVANLATLEARGPGATATAQAWEEFRIENRSLPVIIVDAFDDNSNEWPMGEKNYDLVDVNLSLKEGKYHWELTAQDGFVYWSQPTMDNVMDFSLSVTARQIQGPDNGSYGVVFRKEDNSNYYLLQIRNNGWYSVSRSTDDGWETILGWTFIPNLLPDEQTRIQVIGQGSRFIIYVNDSFVNLIDDENLKEGKVALVAGLDNYGDQGIFEFDDFELRAAE